MREALVVPAARPVAKSRNASSTRGAPNARANRQPSHRFVIKHQRTPPSCQTLTCWRVTRPRPTIKACLQVGAHSASNPTSELSPVAFSVDAYIRTCTTRLDATTKTTAEETAAPAAAAQKSTQSSHRPTTHAVHQCLASIRGGGGYSTQARQPRSTANCPRGGPLTAWKLENAVSKQSLKVEAVL